MPLRQTGRIFTSHLIKLRRIESRGKINVNTIRDQRVWNALTGDNGIGLQPAWSDINSAFTDPGQSCSTAANGRSNTLLADGSSVQV